MRQSGVSEPTTHRGIRSDIQALRAFAVLGVVLFHIWPRALPGGYVGVDVFFVISGFLITGQLVRSRERGTLKLGAFWAARARRLLPASLLVLLASVILTLLWAPPTLQSQYLRSIVASALYFVNWQLAADGVDYLAHDNQPPIAQHYWSLATEEQFYVIWPLLILLGTIGAVSASRRRMLRLGAAAIAVAGFAVCIWLTSTSYPFGYFSTVSRIWEFALGALVALLPRFALVRWAHLTIWVVSLAALIATAFLYDTATPFPGPAALLPTAATAALIAIGPDAPARPLQRVVAWRPVQWLGDQSYGIYLWHWPLVVIVPHVLGRPTDLPENVLILVATVVLAALSKRFVEDPIRFGSRVKALRPAPVLVATAACMSLVVGAAAVPMWNTARAAAEQQEAVEDELLDPSQCRGASVLLDADCAGVRDDAVAADAVVPALAGLFDDTGGAYGCYDYEPTAGGEPTSCTFGSEEGDALRIALTGDSHGAMLVPGLRDVAAARGWSFDTFVGRGCVWQEPATSDCSARNDLLSARFLSGDYDVLLVTAMNSVERDDDERAAVAEEYATAWRAAEEAGVRVVVLADNPSVPQSAQDCVSTASSFTADTCAFPRSESRLDLDPLRSAASLADVDLIDLSDAYCDDDICSMMLGGVLVYRDLHHITATFSRTLAPHLADELSAVFAQRP
ncbi:acyltransferase family protein [Microbacterium sp. NPDC055683]